MTNNPLEVQVGGTHYISNYQPVELFAKLNLNAFQANVVKYVTRYKHKQGREDLEKAIHYCELAEGFGITPTTEFEGRNLREVQVFAEVNDLTAHQWRVVAAAVVRNFDLAKVLLKKLILIEYDNKAE